MLHHELPYELWNNLRLSKLGNIRKISRWGHSQPQSPLQRQSLVIAIKNYGKSRYQSFLLLSNFACFFHFWPYILSGIVGNNLDNSLESEQSISNHGEGLKFFIDIPVSTNQIAEFFHQQYPEPYSELSKTSKM